MSWLFADVLLPLPLKERLTYAIPFEMGEDLRIGMRICVPLGNNRVYAGIVVNLHNLRPSYPTKEILSTLDSEPIVNNQQLCFWQWMATYYLCCEGEVMACALPSGFQLNSESQIVFSPVFEGEIQGLNEKQMRLVNALVHKQQLSIREVSQMTGLKKVFPLIKTLRDLGIIWIKEEISERYKPLLKFYVRWSEAYIDQAEAQKKAIDTLEKKAPKQLDALLSYISYAQTSLDGWVQKALITHRLGEGSHQTLQSLVKKGILQMEEQQESRLSVKSPPSLPASKILSLPQEESLHCIQEVFKHTDVCLLHGVTSSGKTEIYIHLIEEVLSKGQQVLYLLPEIALTTQMIGRLKARFGDAVGVYHSKYNEHEKIEIWQSVGSKYKIILGARSALFLPFSHLGLIVVDEEHETSYKQQDPAPRYHARDAAIYLAFLHKAKVLLGSATPSLESYFNALQGKYGLSTLFVRHANVSLPTIYTANLGESIRQKTQQGHFSAFLIDKISEALKNGKQTILFQNRRGFSAHIECIDCHYIPKCKHCDVTLTYHKNKNILMCHYCGYALPLPEHCPECKGKGLQLRGFGTEKIEEDLQILLPQAKIARMDLDSTRGKNAYENLISAFEDHKIDILVGTQMVTKGLDFDNVGVVGVLNADHLLFFPDFRSYERSFQLMTQVSGRAGRREGQEGEVVLQSYHPEHEVIQCVLSHDYTTLFETQLQERKAFVYPPYCRLIRVSIRHKEEDVVERACQVLSPMLQQSLGKRVLGPEYPLVSRIKTLYIKEFLLKLERGKKLEEMKQALCSILDQFSSLPEYRSCRVIVDVDPY